MSTAGGKSEAINVRLGSSDSDAETVVLEETLILEQSEMPESPPYKPRDNSDGSAYDDDDSARRSRTERQSSATANASQTKKGTSGPKLGRFRVCKSRKQTRYSQGASVVGNQESSGASDTIVVDTTKFDGTKSGSQAKSSRKKRSVDRGDSSPGSAPKVKRHQSDAKRSGNGQLDSAKRCDDLTRENEKLRAENARLESTSRAADQQKIADLEQALAKMKVERAEDEEYTTTLEQELASSVARTFELKRAFVEMSEQLETLEAALVLAGLHGTSEDPIDGRH